VVRLDTLLLGGEVENDDAGTLGNTERNVVEMRVSDVEVYDFVDTPLLKQNKDNAIVSPQFMNKWNVEFTDKVSEVEEETSILNPTNRVSAQQVREMFSGVGEHSMIEEFPRLVGAQDGKAPTKF
jgi:hypothetical protein